LALSQLVDLFDRHRAIGRVRRFGEIVLIEAKSISRVTSHSMSLSKVEEQSRIARQAIRLFEPSDRVWPVAEEVFPSRFLCQATGAIG